MSRERLGVMHFDRAAVLAGFDVSRETSARLDALVATLARWSSAINLVSRATLPDVWHRHVADSAQLFDLVPNGAQSWADLGAGAGFPGLVIAALAADRRPGLRVTLVESDTRKVAFMAEAARAMGVTVALRPVRIEALGSERFDVVSARALAPLAVLLPMARRLLASRGTVLLPKGAEADSELAALPALDREGVERLASITSPDATILRWSARDG
jgi:16S rRNA (guanine527-N7)-methyltransferase